MKWTAKNWFVQDFKGHHGHDIDEWRDYDRDNVPFERSQKVYVPNEDSLEQRMNIFHGQLYNLCWRAIARQPPILYNSEKKAKSVGCKIEDMRRRLCFLYPSIPGCLWMHVEILIDFEQ